MQILPPAIRARPEATSVQGIAPRPRARTGLRLWLLLLAAMLTLPLLGVAIIALLREHDSARRRSEEQLVMQARALALSVDGHLASVAAVARTLAHSGLLARGDLEGFRAEMDAASAGLSGAVVSLRDHHPHLLLTTRMPPGEVPPPATPAAITGTGRNGGQDTVSDLFVGPYTQRINLTVRATVPAPAEAAPGQPATVAVVLEAASFTPLLQAQVRLPGWVATLADRQFRMVSRSADSERYAFHTRMQPAIVAALDHTEAGIARFVRLDGVPVVAGFARAPASGYVASLGMPEAAFDRALRSSVLGVLAVALPVILLGFGMALWLSSRITRAIGALADPAGQAPGGLRLREVDRIAERLAKAERWRTVLMHEMNHRVKNTLMTVQAVASQTLRGAQGDPEVFRKAFMARLATLARAQDLLTANAGQGAGMAATLKAGLAPWLDAGTEVRLTVPEDFTLNAHQAQALILAMHELGTNAAKHGALSRPGGSVAVACALAPDGEAELRWQEAGGPTVAGEPARRGFGSRLLDTVLPQDLGPGAGVQREFRPDGLRATIRFRPIAPDAPPLG